MIEPATRAHLVHALAEAADHARWIAFRADTALAAYPQVAASLRRIAREIELDSQALRAGSG